MTDTTNLRAAASAGTGTTRFICELSDGQELVDVDADAVDVDPAGALRFSDDGLTTLVIAPRVWRSVRRTGSDRLPRPMPKPPAAPTLPLQWTPERR